MSTHTVDVVPVRLEPHPNADRLSIVQVGGFQVVCNTDDWKGRNLGAFVPPDSLVNTDRPEFAFLKDAKGNQWARVRAKKLRGIQSWGLLVPAPEGVVEGQDVMELLGVKHYEPTPDPEDLGFRPGAKVFLGGQEDKAPPLDWVNEMPKYDLENLRKGNNRQIFEPGELVYVTEKLDGSNFRAIYTGGRIHVGSRTTWKREYPDYSHLTLENLMSQGATEEKAREALERVQGKKPQQNEFWAAFRRTPGLEDWLLRHPYTLIYGEMYGNAGRVKYHEENRVRVFDIATNGEFWDADEYTHLSAQLPMVPLIAFMPFDFEKICDLATGDTQVPGARPGTIREGVVVTPAQERWHEKLGRVKLKAVSPVYLEKY